MANRRSAPATLQNARLSTQQILQSLPKLKRRLNEVENIDQSQACGSDGSSYLAGFCQKLNATVRDVFGMNTVEYSELSRDSFEPRFMVFYTGMDTSISGNWAEIKEKIDRTISQLRATIEIMEEQAGVTDVDTASRSIRAFEGLDLHPEIARAVSKLYHDGHYANAVEAAVKVLNGLVRLRSGLEFDGATLMERAFSPSNPVLKFNGLVDQSDRDEQKGFMMMFSGAVAGLRNPRAHGFVQDKPERALEFVAFVSLLAKLLDEAAT